MDINPNLIPIAISLVALCVPWLYDSTLLTRERVAQPDGAERERYSGAKIHDVRNKAHRSC